MSRQVIYPKSKDCPPGTHEEIVFKPDVSVKGDVKLPGSSIGGEVKQRGGETKICTPDNPNPPFQGPPPEQLSGAALDNAIRAAELNVETVLIRLDAALEALEECNQKLEEEQAKNSEKTRREHTQPCGFCDGDPLPCPYCGQIHAGVDRTGPAPPKTDCSAQMAVYEEAQKAYELANDQLMYLISLKNPGVSSEVVAGPPQLDEGVPRLRPPYWRRGGL